MPTRPNIHITSADGTPATTVVAMVGEDGAETPLRYVAGIKLTCDPNSNERGKRHWVAELELAFPQVEIYARADVSESWEHYHRAKRRLDELHLILTTLDPSGEAVVYGLDSRGVTGNDPDEIMHHAYKLYREEYGLQSANE